MAAILPILEGFWMFLVVCATAYVSAAYHGLTVWPAPATVAVQATTLSLSAVGALYYNGLYDFRFASAGRALWGRFFRAVLISGVFIAAIYAWFPGARVRELPLAAAVVLIAFVPLRTAACRIIQSRPFVERVLVVGGGKLAELVVGELQARPSLPYTIVGIVEDATESDPLLGPPA